MNKTIILIAVLFASSIALAVEKECAKTGVLVQSKVTKIRYVQTHVIPGEGLSWSLPKRNASLHLVGQRETMILVDYEDNFKDGVYPHIEVYDSANSNQSTIALVLLPPYQLPPTESNGTAYSNTSFSVRIPPQFMKPGMKVVVSSHTSGLSLPNVGQNSTVNLKILPIYWFGANSTNSIPFDKVKLPDNETVKETFQTWPVSKLEVSTHPIGKFVFPFAIIPASDGGHSYRITNTDQMRSGYVVMNLILSILNGIKSANGESGSNNMYYTPILALNSKGKSVGPGGGLGSIGGFYSTGDSSYTGIFIHEAGHSWGLPHSGEAYNNGQYPYVNGSLLGSQWGFNFDNNEFLSIYVPKTAEYYRNCNRSHVMDNNKCVRQDSMQGGAGDQSAYMKFTMFPDFDLGVMQGNMEGTTTTANGIHSINGGLIHFNPSSGQYLKWDSIDKKYVNFVKVNDTKGLYGFDSGVPMLRDLDVYTVIMQYNTAVNSSCQDCSAVYPITKSKGNLMRYVDPTNQDHLNSIAPNTGIIPWYCHASGCDFTIRATYKDNSKFIKLMNKGVRPWFKPLGDVDPSKTDPSNSNSINIFVENIPANKELSKIELLWTPYGFKSVTPSNATVLLSQSF